MTESLYATLARSGTDPLEYWSCQKSGLSPTYVDGADEKPNRQLLLEGHRYEFVTHPDGSCEWVDRGEEGFWRPV